MKIIKKGYSSRLNPRVNGEWAVALSTWMYVYERE